MPTKILPFGNEKIAAFSVDDRILLGEGVLETLRVEKQLPCYSQLHWQRMCQAAERLEIAFDLSHETWYSKLVHTIQAAQIHSGGVKVILSGGSAARGLTTHGETSCMSFQAFDYPHHEQALHLVSAGWLRDAKNPIYHLKSVSYLEAIIARRHALACGADDVLFFNLDNHATETTVANLFIVKQEKLITPKLTNGVLAGIIRERLLCLCKEIGVACSESAVVREMISGADAVFITNSLKRIQLVASFDTQHFSTYHPLVEKLKRALTSDMARAVSF